ncbi:FAD-dependent oxidoreductase [Nitrosopumilus sp.]|uniref:FAD-dependent oxidoreductase n=1 Tax=Nitrosopumilus sp. TaxID=2024843 RepID=UPI003B5B91C8
MLEKENSSNNQDRIAIKIKQNLEPVFTELFSELNPTFENLEGIQELMSWYDKIQNKDDNNEEKIIENIINECMKHLPQEYGNLCIENIKIEWGKKLKKIESEKGQGITAYFEDGTETKGDLLIGCDGIHSKTRTLMMPDFPSPTYTGTVLVGGIIDDLMQTSLAPNTYHMTFGKNLHFGNLFEKLGRKLWWTYVPYPEDSVKNRTKVSWDEWKKKLLFLLKDEHLTVRKSIEMTKETLLYLPIYNIPHLPTWHKGHVCLIGDAAHAISPHAGQGATMAIEDAVVLAKCLRDIYDIQDAFSKYQQLRKDRVEKMISMARRSGGMFTTTNPIGKIVRNAISPFMIKLSTKGFDEIYGYKVDWDKKIK